MTNPAEKDSFSCFVYRSLRRTDTFLYLCKKDDFSDVPGNIMQHFGQYEFALEFEMSADRRLAQEDPQQVLNNLREHGFHIQLPRQDIEPEWLN